MGTQAIWLGEDRSSSVTKQMGQWVEQVLGGKSFHKYCPGEAWSPAINLYEDETSFILVAEMAGLRVDEIELRVEKSILVISGDRQTPAPPEAAGTIRVRHMEIDHGPFCRSLEMPENADLGTVQACYRGGYLWVRIAKRA